MLSYWITPCRKKKSLRYIAKIVLRENFQLSIFALSLEICHHRSHGIRNFWFFLLVFWFFLLLGKFECHFLWAMQIFQCFSSHNPKRFRQTTLDWEYWRLYHSFINLIEWRERQVTCQQLIGDMKHMWKKYRIFSNVLLLLFSELEIFV